MCERPTATYGRGRLPERDHHQQSAPICPGSCFRLSSIKMDEAVSYKKDWALTQQAFEKLLGWLDADRERAGLKYEELRLKLVSYFDRKHCLASDDLAEDTLNRAARRIVEEEKILDEEPMVYCYRVARLVFLEHWRDPARAQATLDDLPPSSQPFADPETVAEEEVSRRKLEQRLECLDRCTRGLPAETRAMIVEYYQSERREKIERREALARRMKISANALRIRACRVRDKLEACVTNCLAGQVK